MGNNKPNEPVYSGFTNTKGDVVNVETHDKGVYTETITKVDHKDGTSDIYVDKEAK